MIWFFYERIAFSLTKNKWFAKKKIYFSYVLTVFPLFMPKSILLPSLFTKEWPSLFTKEQCEWIALFHERMLFRSFAHKKPAICSKNQWVNSQPWFLNRNQRNLAFPQLFPGQTTCKRIKFLKSLKLTHSIVYTLHKTLYSL